MAIASLVENRRLILPEAETIVWMMVFEDVLLILLISLFSAQGGTRSPSSSSRSRCLPR